MNTILIGIAGGTGSGKTTLTRQLKEHFGSQVTVIGHDSYYRAQPGTTYEYRVAQNYDHPDAFETDLPVRQAAAWNVPYTPFLTMTEQPTPSPSVPPPSSL